MEEVVSVHQDADTGKRHFEGAMATPTVIILGAGPPFKGQTHSALNLTPDKRHVLDWLFEAFANVQPNFHFVGGYQLDEVTRLYPKLSHSINSNWENTGSVFSMFTAPLPVNSTVYVCYSDIVFRRPVIDRLGKGEGDVVLAVESGWQHRFENRTTDDMAMADKVFLQGNAVMAVGKHLPAQTAHGEFIGLVRFSPKAMEKIVELRDRFGRALQKDHLPELITHLIDAGLDVRAVEVGSDWAALDAPQDLARFVLGTKAQTLARLQPILKTCKIADLLALKLGDWQQDRNGCIDNIQKHFGNRVLVVRSSALTEDGWASANAGVYQSILNVPGDDPVKLAQAIDDVAASYDSQNAEHEVLVQEMLASVHFSGVAFTRTLSHGAPYYVINYDDVTNSTESVTSGQGMQLKTAVIHRKVTQLPEGINPILAYLLRTLREVESLVGHDSLDVEFAITADGQVYLFQIRPIAVDQKNWRGNDALLAKLLDEAETLLIRKQIPSPFVFGDKTIFGVMPDWNPAEIIGTSPRRLAASLYRYLIMDDVWATQRVEYGYRDVRPHPLMAMFAGHPYVDTRACFNSFIPASLPDDLAKRLVDHYLARLEANPRYHDKVEFHVVFTCLTLDFDTQAERLKDAGFSDAEIKQIKEALRDITAAAFERNQNDLAVINTLEKRYQQMSGFGRSEVEQVFSLLDDCRRYGTLPFAHLARSAFVAVSQLKSAVSLGIFTPEELQAYLNSIETVAHAFSRDAASAAKGTLAWDAFLDKYGHLRPGTYDITMLSYAEDPERYLRPLLNTKPEQAEKQTAFVLSDAKKKALSKALQAVGLPDDIEQFDGFLRSAIEGREYAKFVFTRNLSMALNLLAKFGARHGLTREQLSHIAIEDFAAIRNGQQSGNIGEWLLARSKEGAQWNAIHQGVELPPLICKTEDLHAFQLPENEANYISQGSITAEVVCLEEETEVTPEELPGKIVLIRSADPGYDWIFGYQIAGLITAYGGGNSHMAIRAAEFGLPAAIGVGEAQFEMLAHARKVALNCSARRIEVLPS